ncbi:MAG: PD-(D/E)XK nuclease family protein [Acidimicrobiaceae bacterium]|nr:PD-(D/E)XK nuclease family protein [Acidimicrobiaceae bacterium]
MTDPAAAAVPEPLGDGWPRACHDGSGLRVMPVEFGEPARRALIRLVSEAKASDPLAPVTVIVSSNPARMELRRATARNTSLQPGSDAQGVAALETLTLTSLAERLVAEQRRQAGDLVIEAAVRNELRDTPGLFEPVAEHPQTAAALARAFGEVRGLSAGERRRLGAMSERAAAVVELCQRVHESLSPGWFDTAELLEAAAANALAGADAQMLGELGRLVLYLPRRLSVGEARLVGALAGFCAAESDLPLLIGVTGDESGDDAAHAVCARLGVSMPTAAPASTRAGATAQQIISVTDADEEVRTVLRSVMADLDAGIAASDIAVFYGPETPYGRAFEEQFEAAGIGTYGSTARTLAESTYGQFALRLTALADARLPEPRLARRDVFDLLAGAQVPRRAAGEHCDGESFFIPDSKWEHLARAARVAGGDDWSVRLPAHAGELDARAERERSSEDPSTRRIEWLRDEAVECRRLAEFIAELRSHLEAGRSRRTWPSLCNWIRAALHRYVGHVGRAPWTLDWPEWQTHAAERVLEALDRLSELGAVESRVHLAAMAQALSDELSDPHGHRGVTGTGVYVGPLSRALDLAPRSVYVVGLVEGILPRRQTPDSLIHDDERRAVGHALPSSADAAADERRALLAALASASGRSTLTVPRGNLRQSAEYVPSRWLAPTVRELTADSGLFSDGYVSGERLRAAAHDDSVQGIVESPSYVTGVLTAAFPATEQEYDAASVWAMTPAERDAADHPLFDDPAFSAGVAMAVARHSSRFTRFDGNLSAVIDGDAAFAEVMSPSRLEAWAACPRRFLFEHLLGVRVIEEPELLLRLSPGERGRLMHAAIDEFFRSFDALRASAVGSHEDADIADADSEWPHLPPGPQRAPDDRDRAHLVAIGRRLAERAERHGLTGRTVLWERDREMLLADLEELLDRDESRDAAIRGQILSSEFRFGLDGGAAAVAYDLEDGTTVRFRGVVDRVERRADGSVIVVDYKSGSARSFRQLNGDDPTLAGTKLQLPVYALAAAKHFAAGDVTAAVEHAAYWFITGQPGRWSWLGLGVDRRLMDRFGRVVNVIVSGIRGGVFPGHAEIGDDRRGYTVCPYCDPDGLGTAEVRRDWLRKRSDGALAGFVALVEPEAMS